MILFFGTRPSKAHVKKLFNVSCPYCNQTNTMTASTHSNYFHLFWIKLFKISSQITAECSHCKKAFYKNEFTQEMDEALNKKRLHDKYATF